MRKTALLVAIILILAMPLSVAAQPRTIVIRPTLSFSGTTANCKGTVVGNNTSDHIEVLLKLMHGPYCVGTWYDSGYGFVIVQGSTTVIQGDAYELVIEATINNVKQPSASITDIC